MSSFMNTLFGWLTLSKREFDDSTPDLQPHCDYLFNNQSRKHVEFEGTSKGKYATCATQTDHCCQRTKYENEVMTDPVDFPLELFDTEPATAVKGRIDSIEKPDNSSSNNIFLNFKSSLTFRNHEKPVSKRSKELGTSQPAEIESSDSCGIFPSVCVHQNSINPMKFNLVDNSNQAEEISSSVSFSDFQQSSIDENNNLQNKDQNISGNDDQRSIVDHEHYPINNSRHSTSSDQKSESSEEDNESEQKSGNDSQQSANSSSEDESADESGQSSSDNNNDSSSSENSDNNSSDQNSSE